MLTMISFFLRTGRLCASLPKIVAKIPGSTVAFTVEKYKKVLAKPFSKVDLYICKLHDLTSMVYINDDSPDNNVVTPDDGTTIDSYCNAAVEDNFPDETPSAATSSSTSMSTIHKVFCPSLEPSSKRGCSNK